jgi:hypothetical protein
MTGFLILHGVATLACFVLAIFGILEDRKGR